MPVSTSAFAVATIRPDQFIVCNLCSPGGRGIPDISAQGYQYLFACGGTAFYASGTSCSTPVRLFHLSAPVFSLSSILGLGIQLTVNVQTVAGIITLLNDYRLSIGKRPLGFLNPWLYGRGKDGITDITSGSNPGCNTEGFTATTGWDPVCIPLRSPLHF